MLEPVERPPGEFELALAGVDHHDLELVVARVLAHGGQQLDQQILAHAGRYDRGDRRLRGRLPGDPPPAGPQRAHVPRRAPAPNRCPYQLRFVLVVGRSGVGQADEDVRHPLDVQVGVEQPQQYVVDARGRNTLGVERRAGSVPSERHERPDVVDGEQELGRPLRLEPRRPAPSEAVGQVVVGVDEVRVSGDRGGDGDREQRVGLEDVAGAHEHP